VCNTSHVCFAPLVYLVSFSFFVIISLCTEIAAFAGENVTNLLSNLEFISHLSARSRDITIVLPNLVFSPLFHTASMAYFSY